LRSGCVAWQARGLHPVGSAVKNAHIDSGYGGHGEETIVHAALIEGDADLPASA
jgi:hypothetical protein